MAHDLTVERSPEKLKELDLFFCVAKNQKQQRFFFSFRKESGKYFLSSKRGKEERAGKFCFEKAGVGFFHFCGDLSLFI